MLDFMKGKKTYITGIGMIIWGAFQWFVEDNQAEGLSNIMQGAGFMTVRSGINKLGE